MKYSIKNDLQTTVYEENKFIVCVDISKNRVKDAWVTGKMIGKIDLLFGSTNLSNIICNIKHEYLFAVRSLLAQHDSGTSICLEIPNLSAC
jgi:hypothetical protein